MRRFKGRTIVENLQTGGRTVRRQTWTHPAALSATALKALTATSASVVTTITPSAQPDFARTINVTPGGTTNDVAAGAYTLTGTDIRGNVITEDLTFSANATTKQVSTKAFKTLTSLLCPVQDGSGATFSIGYDDGLGLDRCMSEAAVIDFYTDGVRETTAATVGFSATNVALNTVDPNTALANTKVFTALFVPTEKTTNTSTTS